MGREEDEASRDLSPVGQARELAAKGIGGWIEGTGDRAIQYIGGTVIGSAAVTALLALLKAHWPIVLTGGISATVFFGFLAQLISAVRDARAAARGSQLETKEIKDQIRGLLGEIGRTAKSDSPAAGDGSMMFGSIKAERLSGLAIVRSLGVFYAKRPSRWLVSCVVDFIGIAPNTDASPWELLLTGKGGSPDLAVLKATKVANGSGPTFYSGEASLHGMEDAISNTMGKLMNSYPPAPNTFVELDVRLPSGQALASHVTSKVRISTELMFPDPRTRFIVRVESNEPTDHGNYFNLS